MGWDDDSHKDENAFKSILRFLRDEGLKVRAILWMILPNIRQAGDSFIRHFRDLSLITF